MTPTTSKRPGMQPDEILDQQRQLWLDGQCPSIESLLKGTPFETDREVQLDLIYGEIVLLEELGEQPSLDEYALRFPHLKQDLDLHFEIHRAIRDQLLVTTGEPWSDESWPEPKSQPSVSYLPTDAYEIDRELGRGGMAVVYQARHRQLQRLVALKTFQLGRSLTSREASRIRTEAEAIARLAHPNIVQIYEIGDCHGSPYLALELAEHGTLAQRLQRSPLPPEEAAQLIETLARAVHHAHERQVIHRDLKPANVLFMTDGTPKITDFGLAKVLLDNEVSPGDATRTGDPIGTPRYMSPEQAAGRSDTVGPATDVYALGTLLYECLTGRAPFVSSSVVETLRMISNDDPLPPRRLQTSIPRDLETICLHCLAKDPGRRYATAEDLADDLHRYRFGEPIRVRPISVVEHVWKWCRRRPAQATLIAVFLLGTVAAFAATAIHASVDRQRIADLRTEVAVLTQQGRNALDRDELEVAQSKFQAAWLIVQSEPSLSDHEASVAGWLDHSRNAANRYQWKQRIPPREYDERRDAALVESLLVVPYVQHPIAVARDSLEQALELTLPGDPAWTLEREQLSLINAELVALESGPAKALEQLDSLPEFSSYEYWSQRAEWFTQLSRSAEAEHARLQADRFPPRREVMIFHTGMDRMRQHRFRLARQDFERVLDAEPEHFVARLALAICDLHLQRAGEAKVGLTACIAQRPRFAWSYIFRSAACRALGESTAAIVDLERALECGPVNIERYVAIIQLGRWQWLDGDRRSSTTHFTEATKLLPHEPAGWVHLACVEMLEGQYELASSHFQEALHLNPMSRDAAWGQTVLGLLQRNYPSAYRHFESILRHDLEPFHRYIQSELQPQNQPDDTRSPQQLPTASREP
ncbi:MAG: serine/threonine-protein kinase [Planctomycetaceae bacterium]